MFLTHIMRWKPNITILNQRRKKIWSYASMNEDKTIKMILSNLQVCNCSSSRV